MKKRDKPLVQGELPKEAATEETEGYDSHPTAGARGKGSEKTLKQTKPIKEKIERR